METLDYQSQFERMKKDAVEAVRKALDVRANATGLQLRANDVWVEDNQSSSDWVSQKDAVRKDKTWGVPIYASVDLVDGKSGSAISTAKKVKVATLPKNTDLGSFIVDGKNYQVQNQFRRKPGVYITEKKNREKKAEINIPGRPFDINIDPKTSELKLGRGPAESSDGGLPLYPILSRMGISDSMLSRVWGEDVLEANKNLSPKKSNEAVKKAAKYFVGERFDSADDAVRAMAEYFEQSEVRPEVTEDTIGKGFTKVTPELILRGSNELMRAARGERAPDDRQALEYKKALAVSDLMRERLLRPNGELSPNLNQYRRKIYRKLNNQRQPPEQVKGLVNAGDLEPFISSFFTRSSLSNTTDQTNPLNMLNGMSKITVMGDGGVSDAQRVRAEERAVHPSHLGFVDPIHTPDSQKIGTVMTLPIGVQKEGDELKTRVIDAKTGKQRFISPREMKKSTVAFPDQFKDGAFVDRKVKAVAKGEVKYVSSDQVDAVLATPKQAFSISSNTIPMLPAAQGVRAQAATKMLEQAIPLKGREAPKVQVKLGNNKTIEGNIGKGFSVEADVDGVVKEVRPSGITVETEDGEVEYPLFNDLPLGNKSFLNADPIVKPGDEVRAGQTLADSNFTDNGVMALGTNLRAAYIPWKGYNFEDGIVITESASEKLSSEHMHQVEEEPGKGEELSLKRYNAMRPNDLTAEQAAKLGEDGVIRKGQIVKKGDPLWVGVRDARHDPDFKYAVRLNPALADKPFRGNKKLWSKDADGKVVDVVRKGKKVKAYIKTVEPAKIGDKLTNRHGGKGIITKVIPDGESPYTADGTPADILLNPHGVVSRINPSQLLETAAGKVAEKTGKPFVVDNFSGENYTKTVSDALKKVGVSDVETMYDPHSKEALGDVLVGPQHILKLSKQATSQFSARSEGKYDIHESPLSGGEDGSKALDMLTFYSMLSHGSRANLREMATYKANKNEEFWNWLQGGNQAGMIKPPPQPTFAYKEFENYLRAAGVDMKRRGSKLAVTPLTDKEVEKLSSGEVKDPVFKRAKDLKDERGGLSDPQIFGADKGRWGHIDLAEPVPNPVFKDPIKSLTGLKEAQYNALSEGDLFIDPKTGEFTEDEKNGLTGGVAVQHLLKQINVDDEIKRWTDKAKSAGQRGSEKALNDANKKLRYLSALKKNNLRPDEAYVQKKLPVLPPKFRPIMELADGSVANAGINQLYRDVMLVNNELKWQNSLPFIDQKGKADLRKNLYGGVQSLAGLGSPITNYPEKRRPKGVIEKIKGEPAKTGFFQHNVLRRRQNLVGRGTIIPEPKLGVDEVGLPEDMSWTLFEKFAVRRLVNQNGYNPADADTEVKSRSRIARDALEAEMRDRPVMLNRAPSLHKFSIMSFKPKMTSGKAIKIPPLVVKGFNADFDGDAMTVHVPILPDAVKEAENMLPSKNLYNPGTGDVMIQPQNEAALGLYMMSKDPEKKEKVLEAIPESLRDKYRGKTLDKKNLRQLLRDVASEVPGGHGQIVDKLKQMGDEHTYNVGFTVGVKDLAPNIPEREEIFRKVDNAVKSLDLSNPKQREQATEIMAKANQELTEAVDRRLGEQGNNFHLMVKSGARGNMNQLKQVVSTPFMVDDHRGNPTPVPVMKSFAEGLPFSDYWSTTYGARAAAVDKQLQTSAPGAFNKDIMASSVSNVIAKDDCGTTGGISVPLKKGDAEDRFLAEDVRVNGNTIASSGSPVTSSLLNTLREGKVDSIKVRSPLTCKLPKGTCAKCYGMNEDGQTPDTGDNVGATSGQSLSEPLTQMTLRTFHQGGVSGTRGIIDGYEKIDKLFKMPEIKSGRATLAQEGGKVEDVKNASGGTGKVVTIKGKEHFVPKELWSDKVRVGSTVSKGDILSEGIVQPQELVKLKGMLEAQDYISGQIQEAYESQGVPMKRRSVETVVRAVGNTTRVVDPGDSTYLPGDVAPWTDVQAFNDQSLGRVPVKDSKGRTLREDVEGVPSGSVIDDRIQETLKNLGKTSVEVGPRPIRDKPFLTGIENVPMLRKDWMSQMGYRELKNAIVRGSSEGEESDIHGYAPVPAFAYGAEFGQAPDGKSKTEGVY